MRSRPVEVRAIYSEGLLSSLKPTAALHNEITGFDPQRTTAPHKDLAVTDPMLPMLDWNLFMRTVLFDLDGTLTDPLLGITRSVQNALTSIGQHPPETNELTWCIGPPLLDTLRELVGDELALQALEYYRDRFGKVGLYENALYSGVPDMPTQLAQAGLKLCVASSKRRIYVKRIVDHFGLRTHFAGIYGSELDGTWVNKGDLIRYVLSNTGAARASVTMVGDRRHDIVGAVENGVDHIGVLYGYGTADELRQSGTHRFSDTPSDLVGLLLERV